MKAFTDDKINVTKTLKFVLGWIENTVGTGEKTGYQHFLFFHNIFKGFLYRVVKSRECVVKIFFYFFQTIFTKSSNTGLTVVGLINQFLEKLEPTLNMINTPTSALTETIIL